MRYLWIPLALMTQSALLPLLSLAHDDQECYMMEILRFLVRSRSTWDKFLACAADSNDLDSCVGILHDVRNIIRRAQQIEHPPGDFAEVHNLFNKALSAELMAIAAFTEWIDRHDQVLLEQGLDYVRLAVDRQDRALTMLG